MTPKTLEMTSCSFPAELDKDLLSPHLARSGLQIAADECHVQWAPANPRHPRNWSRCRKIYDTSLVIFLEFFTTAVSTSGSTSARDALHEFAISRELSVFIFVSLYLLGQGFGAIAFPPYSEAFGRRKLYVVSTALYGISCAIVAAVPSLAGVVVGRFISGVLSAIPTTVVIGSIEDLFNARDRVWVIYCWAMVANMGMLLGPIFSTYITAELGWRWLFYVAAIVTGVVSILLLTIRESRPSLLLAGEVAHLRETTNIPTLKAFNPDQTPSLLTFIQVALARPVRLFFTELLVFIVSTMSAIAIALVYLFVEALPPVYQDFAFTPKQACLPFLAMLAGLFLGILTRCQDLRILARHKHHNRPLLPEDKLTGFSIGVPVLAASLWLFAWTIPPIASSTTPHIHWIVSALALVFIGYGLNEIDYVLGGYLTDSYLSYAASGLAALSIVRALLSAALPLIAGPMFAALGNNVAVSVLAAVATALCVVPPVFARYGAVIRGRSAFAKFSLKVYLENSVDEEGY
ncbi:MFS general substrate transporter [Aspergillus taichungensis]|uniref:MFS general substrate transporter n=1 Tax=Aspergillus taichungensis TaxID=482145 RepID=A0A2J5HGI3_9EURO|nr:MFS general substrate transporter [Aspergillus taichungensis]